MMADIQDALSEGDIHIRDKNQFELTTEYVPSIPERINRYTLTFYFFIPSSLQIHSESYTKQQFYSDQTNFIRLKTPAAALQDLLQPNSKEHPLLRAQQILYRKSLTQDRSRAKEEESEAVEALKIYANMVRSSVRNEAHTIWTLLHRAKEERDLRYGLERLQTFCLDIKTMRRQFLTWQSEWMLLLQEGHVEEYSRYIDEFISTLCEYYAASLLRALEQIVEQPTFPTILSDLFIQVKQQLTACMVQESQHRIEHQERSVFADDPERASEYMLYRKRVLKKFVSEALLLSMTRTEPQKRFLDIVTPIVAGLSMLFYLYFLSFHSTHPIFDSSAFLLVTAIVYVMRDRMKESFKQIASRLSSHWFPDYQTTIRTPDGMLTLGSISESVHFCLDSELPEKIQNLHKQHFHEELHQARRMENILCFSKTVSLFPKVQREDQAHAFVDIFRYNISRFLAKAGDPYKEELIFNPASQKVEFVKSPKVYHIPVILQYDFVNPEGKQETEHKCYRIILDKQGIKRIEKV